MADEPPADQADEPQSEIRITGFLELRGGVWANFARVSHSPHEFTIDFIRLDYTTRNPVEGIIVQRVNMSPQFVHELIGALQVNLTTFIQNAVPDGLSFGKEVDDGGS